MSWPEVDRREKPPWHKRANIHVRENWYRDVWLFAITVVVVIGVIRSVNQSNTAVDRTYAIQASRIQASHDSCEILRRLIFVAASKNPKAKHPHQQAEQFLHEVGLGDCTKFANRLRINGNSKG